MSDNISQNLTDYPNATAWRRLLALVYDILIVVAILIFAGAVGLVVVAG